MKPRPLLLFVGALLLGGCASLDQGRVKSELRAQLKAQSFSAEQLGIELVEQEGRQTVRWRERVSPRTPVRVLLLPPDSPHSVQPRVEVVLNDKLKTPFIVDTGAALTGVNLNTGLGVGARVADPETFRNTFVGLGGEEDNYYAMVERLEIGALSFQDVFTVLRPLNQSGSDNVLGMASLAKLAWFTIDYPVGEIVFGPGVPLPELQFPAAVVPLEFRSLQLHTTLVVNREFEFEVVVDTGNDAMLMLPNQVVKELGLSKAAARGVRGKYGSASGTIRARTFTIPRVTMGGVDFENVQTVAVPDHFPPTLGSAFLKNYRVTFDMVGKRMFLEKREDSSGVQAAQFPGRTPDGSN